MAFNPEIKGYMTFGKSFSRSGAFSIEAYEVWTDYDALVAYAANTDPNKDPSYIGQKVAYIDTANNKVVHYGIEIDGSLKELGAMPVGDGKSISVDANGVISLLGIESADSLTLPRMKEDKSGIEWVPVSQVVEGDGNDNTTYTFTPVTKGEGEDAETYGFIVKTFFNGVAVEGGEFTFGFDVYTKSEVDAAIKEVADLVGVPAEDDDSTDTLYERIAAEVLRATNAESALSDRIGVAKDGETAATGVYAYVDGVVNALVNGVDPDKIDSLNELIAWVEAHPDIVSGLDERLDAVETILDGIGGEGEKATVKDYVDDALAAHELAADGKYAAKATTLAGYGITDAYTKNEVYTKGEADKAIADKISEVNGGESAGEVLGQLNAYKKINDTEVWGAEKVTEWTDAEGKYNPTYAGDSRVDLIDRKLAEIEEKAEVNIIETIKVNGADLTPDANRAVDITVPTSIVGMGGYTELDGRVTKNTNDIAALTGQLGTTNGNVSGILQRLGALETEVGVAENSRIDALEGVLNGAGDTEGLVAIVTGHGTRIGLLEAADTRIEKKADDNAAAILALQNKVDTGDKSVKTYVDDAVKAVADTIDFSPYAKTEDVAKTYATIANLNTEKGRIDTLVGADTGKSARAIATEEIAKVVNSAPEDFDTLKEIADYIASDKTNAATINNKLAAHDAILAGIGGEDQPTTVIGAIEAAKYVLPAATIDALGGIKSAKDVVDGETTTVAVNKVYVDADGIAEVKAFNTDNLVQGSMTLVLNGGNAEVSAS